MMDLTLDELKDILGIRNRDTVRVYLCRGEFTNHIFLYKGVVKGILTEDIERLKELVKPRIIGGNNGTIKF